MRLYRLPEPGSIDNLRLEEAADPKPGPFEVLVRVRATSLNYRDLSIARGAYGRGGHRPNLVPLSDGAGEVAVVGAGVTRVKPGDRVAGIFMQRWIAGEITPAAAASALGGAIDGMLAELVVLHEDGLVHLPEPLSFEEGATLPCAAVTAWHALVDVGRTKPAEDVLVLGTGGVSIFALQFAGMHGARVVATSSSDGKLERLRGMGAGATINYRSTPEWQDAVTAATGGRGVDLTVEVGGAGTLPRSIAATRMGGTIGLIGVLTGGEINPTMIMRKTIALQGIYVGSRAMFEAMNRAITVHRLQPVIDKVFPFEDAKGAYRYLESGAHFGKVVIRV
ncbi:MAG TPA: NAD(P)-dependent alcohol dehydrogenase [Acetobacteraceae bacterium]|nr:NAD(P)-dependent alcohol dehydrogenase [Acetobacteraceae bacterium]